MKRYIVGVTGASGSVLAQRMLTYLSGLDLELHIIITDIGKKVFEYETGLLWEEFVNGLRNKRAVISSYSNGDMFAPVASGSFETDGMMIVPCSMSTVAKIASGTGGNLLCRAADVCIKEKTRLVISPREAPLSSIHLKNLLTLSDIGVSILPPVPMFYGNNGDVEDVINGIVGRLLKSAGIENHLFTVWGSTV
ncbi:MAG: UbiX family flavin prenyltransferase [Anaerocolumna sp.]